MNRTDTYDPVTNETDVYYQFQTEALLQEQVTILPAAGSSNITTIIAGGGGSVTGPTVDIDGGVTGYDFVAAGITITLVLSNAATARTALGLGTMAVVNSPVPIANGGTGATTVAGILSALGIAKQNTINVAPTVNDDSGDGYSVNSLWTDTTGPTTYVCQDAAVGAAVWTQIAP